MVPILKEVRLWVKCYQTARHATEKLFVKGKVTGAANFTAVFLKFIFNWRIIAILCWFLPYISHRYTYVPSLLNLPSTSHARPTPLGCHRASDLSSTWHAADSHWLSVLHMVMCVFQCYSLSLSQPLLPHGVHKSVSPLLPYKQVH